MYSLNYLKINLIFTIFILLLLSSLNVSNAFNPLKIYSIKQWQYQNCTGKIYEFLSFYEDQLYSSLMDAHFDCDPNYLNGKSINCKITVNENKQSENKMTIELTQGICNNGKTLDYITTNNFKNYLNNNEFNVITEYGNEYCEYDANFYLGILNNSCVYGWSIKSLNGNYEIQKCHINDYNNASNYTTNQFEYFEKLTTFKINNGNEYLNSLCVSSIIDTKPSHKSYRIISKQIVTTNFENIDSFDSFYADYSIAITILSTISIKLILLLISIILIINFY